MYPVDGFHIVLPITTGLRDCVKWMQGAEQEQGYFYDLVVRLRDDTFAFADWIFDSTEMKNALTRWITINLFLRSSPSPPPYLLVHY